MKLANLKSFECLVNDFVNTGERDLERRRGKKGSEESREEEGEIERKKARVQT